MSSPEFGVPQSEVEQNKSSANSDFDEQGRIKDPLLAETIAREKQNWITAFERYKKHEEEKGNKKGVEFYEGEIVSLKHEDVTPREIRMGKIEARALELRKAELTIEERNKLNSYRQIQNPVFSPDTTDEQIDQWFENWFKEVETFLTGLETKYKIENRFSK